MTVRPLPSKRTLAPLEVGCRPSPASITPDLTSSSLYSVIAPRASVLGISPASDSGLPGTRTMKRIYVSLWWMGWFLPARRTRSAKIDTPGIFFLFDIRRAGLGAAYTSSRGQLAVAGVNPPHHG